MSHNILAEVSAATGHSIATVWDEWPGRDLSVDPVPDEEIIPHLGAKGGCRAVWITADWNARKRHRDLIDAQQISVLWMLGPGNRNLTVGEQRQTLIVVLATVYRIVANTNVPVYLRAKYGPRPALERLAGGLLEAPLRWAPAAPG